jgi:hypothetical protein
MLGTTNPTSNPQSPQMNAVPSSPVMASTPTATAGAPNQNPPRAPKQPKKLFGVDSRALLTVLGLTLFFILAMAGVVISLRQRIDRVAVAPNAPESRPSADVVTPANCSLSFVVLADEGEEPEPTPPDEEEPEPTPPDEEEPEPTPPDEEEPVTYSCNSACDSNDQCASANADYICHNNRCRLQTNVSSTSCQAPTGGTPQYTCNSTCDTTEQCQTASPYYICYQNRCRLDINPSNSSCIQPQDQTEVQVSCNDACSSNAECSNPSHICFNGQCRLETNPESANCTRPSTVTPGTPVLPESSDAPQPELPAELPKSGPEDWGNWLKAGLAALGVGAVLLLLL